MHQTPRGQIAASPKHSHRTHSARGTNSAPCVTNLQQGPSLTRFGILLPRGKGPITQLQLVKTSSTILNLILYNRHTLKAQIDSMPSSHLGPPLVKFPLLQQLWLLSFQAIVALCRGRIYLKRILIQYTFTVDLVKSFSSSLQPDTQKPPHIDYINNTINIPLLYVTPTHRTSYARSAFLVLRSGTAGHFTPFREGSQTKMPGTILPQSPIARHPIIRQVI